MSGFLPIPRSFFEGALWSEKRAFSKAEAFLYLLSEARYEPGIRWVSLKSIPLNRGELVASLRFLAEAWGWSKDRVGRFLDALETAPEPATRVRRETRQGETIVILCGYEDWAAGQDTERDSDKDAKRDDSATILRQRRDKTEERKERNTLLDAPSGPASASKPTTKAEAIAWNFDEGFSGITDKDFAEWQRAYPAVDIESQLARAHQWLKANPAKARKSQWRRFVTGWLSRSQDRGGDIASVRPKVDPLDSYELTSPPADRLGFAR